MVGGELEHLLNLSRRANGATTNLDAACDEGEGVDRRKVTTIWGTDLNEATLDLQEGKVAVHGHVLAGDGGNDEVKGTSVGLVPVLVIVGSNVPVSTELENLILLGCLAGDTNDLIGTKCLGEEDTEVAEATNTDNTDL